VGTPQFEAFAKAYLDKFKFGVVSSGEFKDYFLETFGGNKKVKGLNWDELFYNKGK
jgi:hypothetical protein